VAFVARKDSTLPVCVCVCVCVYLRARMVEQDDVATMEQRMIDFAWTLVDWRTFDPASPLVTFPGDAIIKRPSALELLVINLKTSTSSAVHYACCCAIAYLAVRQDVRASLYESTVGPLMEALDLFVRRCECTWDQRACLHGSRIDLRLLCFADHRSLQCDV
jgi:hypothetical protein